MGTFDRIAGVAVLALIALVGFRSFAWKEQSKPTRVADSRETIRINRVRSSLLSLPEKELALCFGRISPPSQPHTTSFYLHILRLHGVNATLPHATFDSSHSLLRILTEDGAGRQYLGAPVPRQTRHGVALVGNAESAAAFERTSESHRDQILAAFGELGIPLSQPLTIGEETFTLADVLSDSIANFHLGQQELQWTALAYAVYLSPTREWTNKFGDTTTFDMLVARLIESPLWESSCAGTHLVSTLTTIYRVDTENTPILAPPTRETLRERLEQFAKCACETQKTDGSWDLEWYRGALRDSKRILPTDSTLADRLLVTGHLAEWLLYLPEDFGVPDHVIKNAALWLLPVLTAQSVRQTAESICPSTHAACVLKAVHKGPVEPVWPREAGGE